jgi:DNA polymerase-1
VDLLLVDGDGLAYYCAGKDGTPAEKAYSWVSEMVGTFAAMTQARDVRILLTAEASPKGGRYAVATVKPYQGQRKSSRRPDNWKYLRRYLEAGRAGEVQVSTTAEADDLFAYHSVQDYSIAIATQDKDMRMVPGLHVTWDRQRLFYVPPGKDSNPMHNGLQYGQRWFWEQMLQGDSADFIPGLPLLYGKKCGGVSAKRYVDGCYAVPGEDPMGHVRTAYGNLYKDEGDDRFLEQACLLWMRRRPIDPLDMARSGGPLEHFDNEDALERLRKRATGED